MATFVHLAEEKSLASIRRGGIRPHRKRIGGSRGVFAMPVTRNFYVSHQWLRELKRRGQRTISAVYFRIPDEQPVNVGHYGTTHRALSASQATAIIMQAERPEGYEIIIPRRIEASEIFRVRSIPQVLGWRYRPGAHGTKPCGCPVCIPRGEIRSRKLRERYRAGE